MRKFLEGKISCHAQITIQHSTRLSSLTLHVTHTYENLLDGAILILRAICSLKCKHVKTFLEGEGCSIVVV